MAYFLKKCLLPAFILWFGQFSFNMDSEGFPLVQLIEMVLFYPSVAAAGALCECKGQKPYRAPAGHRPLWGLLQPWAKPGGYDEPHPLRDENMN